MDSCFYVGLQGVTKTRLGEFLNVFGELHGKQPVTDEALDNLLSMIRIFPTACMFVNPVDGTAKLVIRGTPDPETLTPVDTAIAVVRKTLEVLDGYGVGGTLSEYTKEKNQYALQHTAMEYQIVWPYVMAILKELGIPLVGGSKVELLENALNSLKAFNKNVVKH
jgi:hypothetical protein